MSPIPDFIVEIRELIGTHPLWLPGVTAVIVRDEEILLVRRADNGAWTPVTGIVEPGEEPAVAAAREAMEETGVEITVDRLASTSATPEMTYPNGDRACYLDLTFACTWVSGEAHVADDESVDARWWPLDGLPDLSEAMLRRISDAVEGGPQALFATDGSVRETRPRPRRVLPHRPVLGVDACAAGWVGVLVDTDGRATVHVAATIADLMALVRETAVPAVVAVDIPIGLPDRGGRVADAEARHELVGKGASLFSTPTRAAYEAPTYEEARAANLAVTEGSTSVSAQAYALREKVLQVDAWVRGRPGAEVIEVHPELSFARMSGAPILASKKQAEGALLRREALSAQGFVAPGWFRGAGFAEDDLLDACATAWSAIRHERGTSESWPDVPEVFADGIGAAIRA